MTYRQFSSTVWPGPNARTPARWTSSPVSSFSFLRSTAAFACPFESSNRIINTQTVCILTPSGLHSSAETLFESSHRASQLATPSLGAHNHAPNTVSFRTPFLESHRVLQALMSSLTAIVERPPPRGRTSPTISTPPSLMSRDDTGGLSTSPPAAAATTTTTKKRPPSDALSLLKHRPGFDGAALGSPAAAASETDPAIANVFYGLKPIPEVVPAQKSRSGRGGSRTASAASRSSRRVTARTGSPTGSAAVRPSTAGGREVGGGKSTLSRMGKELVHSGEIGRVGLRGGEGDGEGGAGALGTRLLAAGR